MLFPESQDTYSCVHPPRKKELMELDGWSFHGSSLKFSKIAFLPTLSYKINRLLQYSFRLEVPYK